MALIPNSELGVLIGNDAAELITLTPGQLATFPLGVLTLGGNDTVFGSVDNEQINGNTDEDELAGGGGDDTLFGGKNNDVLDGQAGNDFLFGNLNADLMRGGQGDDNLFGGADNDILFGDFGNDLIAGDLGVDVVTGGDGADVFVLPLRGIDTDFISDFEDGIDSMLLPTGVTFNQLSITLRGSDQTVIALGTEELAVLDDVLPDVITAADFIEENNSGGGGNGNGNNNGGEIPRDNAIILRLDQGFLYNIELETPLRIMPLGDSITEGQVDRDTPEFLHEGYRIGLWNKLAEFGIPFDFVGSKSSGTENLPDTDHEGHSGFSTNQLTFGKTNEPDSGVDNWIPAANPNMILLMIGTNNAGNPPDDMLADLDELMDRIITENGYTGKLFVSTIPPLDPAGRFEERIPTVEAYNAGIPTVVNAYAQQGNDLVFVDMVNVANGLTFEDINQPPDDSGIHPTEEGYDKIAAFWFNAILNQVGSREVLSDPNNGIGTDFNDVIVGNGEDNRIEGRQGADRLSGGAGADIFMYTAPNQGLDTITDFNVEEGDRLGISAVEFGGGLVSGNPLSTTNAATGIFVSSPNPNPIGNSAHFLYNSSSGLLSFDVDGVGGQPSVELALLTGVPELTVNQFLIL
jgi:serralysin